MKIARACLIASPVFFAAYGVVRYLGRLDGQYGPGFDWQAAHILNLVGLLLLVPGLAALGRELPPAPVRTWSIAVTLVGLVTSVVQFVVDIVVGLLAGDKAEMRELSGQFSSIPGVRLVFYTVGPPLLYVGLVVLAVLLVRVGKLPWWSPVLILVGSGLAVVSLDLIPFGGLCMLLALIPFVSRVDERARHAV